MSKYIPEDVIEACAKAAHYAIEKHYGAILGRLNETESWVLNSNHVKERVKKDVKAVLYGNRTAANLHDAWSDRKIRFLGSITKVNQECPTALMQFDRLSPSDRAGYELFVNTVKAKYAELTKQQTVTETKTIRPLCVEIYGSEWADTLYQLVVAPGRPAAVVLYFDSMKNANSFVQALK